jgi:peptidoglycan/LPS O-acetylase OafA/YrhL
MAYLYFSFKSDSGNFQHNLKTAIYALFGISNLFLLFTGSKYFIEQNENSFLHTWSLGVEEQFYLFWPMFLVTIFFFSSKKKIFFLVNAIFLTIIIVNLTYNEFIKILGVNILNNFYSPIFRSFELIIGSTLFFFQSATTPPEKKLPHNHYNYLSFKEFIHFLILNLTKFRSNNYKNLSIIGILIIIFLLNLKNIFFLNALISCIGICLIILDTNNNSFLNKILKKRSIVYLGKISYSLYLWHPPIIILSINYFNNIDHYIFSSVLIFLISCISYHLVEKPIRDSQNYYSTIKKILIIYLILFIIFIISLQFGYIKKNLNKSLSFLQRSDFNYFTKRFGSDLFKNNLPFYSIHGNCQIDWNSYFLKERNNLENIPLEKWSEELLNTENKCFFKKNSRKIIFFVGDSSATALASIADIKEYDLAILTKGGWIFSNNLSAINNEQYKSKNFSRIKEEEIYVDRVLKIFDKLSKNYDKLYLVISSRYDSYMSNDYHLLYYSNNSNYYELKDMNQDLPNNILELINKFPIDTKVIFIKNTPKYKYTFEECFTKLNRNLIKNCDTSYVENFNLEKSNLLLKKIRNHRKNIYIFDFNNTVCKDKACKFFFKKDQSFVIDTLHMNPITSINLQKFFKKFINAID